MQSKIWLLAALTVLSAAATAASPATTPSAYKLSPAEFRALRGEYSLCNGQSLRIYREGARILAAQDDGRGEEIYALSPEVLVNSVTGQKLTVKWLTNGVVAEIGLSDSR
jgi:hypothetical protein